MSIIKPSLRLKLTLWFMLIFMVVFMGVLYGAWVVHREMNERQLDDWLLQLAEGVAGKLKVRDTPSLIGGLRPFQPIDRTFVVLAVRDASGKVIGAWWPVDTEALPPIPGDGDDKTVHPLDGDVARRLLGRPITSRMITYRFMTRDGTANYVDVAKATDIAREERSFLLDAFVIGAMGSLLASVLAAWLIAGRAVEPIKELTRAAEQIDPEHFGSRVDVGDTSAEVEKLQSALNDALARLETGYRAQERFISNVAHDLKTPIAVMLTESQVLRKGSVSLEEFEAYRQSMVVEMQRLGGLVESFLTIARADQGEALARTTDVSGIDILMEAVAVCNHEAVQMDVRLVPTVDESGAHGGDADLRGDPDLLRAMLVNLVRNAIRHSAPRDTVVIRLLCGDDYAEYSVRDHGPGVPEEMLEFIFDRFVQAPTSPAAGAGTGLGLAIARSIAELHRGSITVENCADRGCIFTVRLPAASPPRPRGAAAERDRLSSSGDRRAVDT